MHVFMNTEADHSGDLASRIGSRIRALRRARHITQLELSRRLGIKPGPMNVIEKGRHVPSGRVLYRLAQELGVTVDDLFGKEPLREAASVVPFLPFLDTPGNPEAVSKANELAGAFTALEDLCGAMKSAVLPLHIPFAATDAGIEQLVAQVRHHLGITQAVVFDYLELLENAGLRVVFCDLPADATGEVVTSLCAYDRVHANAFFFIQRTLNAERQLFRLLFELGRIYWYTRQMIVGTLPARGGELLDEIHAARKFAAFLLMPAMAVRGTVSQLGITSGGWTYELMLRIKHRFGVSAESFCIRLEELGLIDGPLAAGFKARIREHYAESGYAEPDGSQRRLNYNGRLGDLLLNARGKEGEDGDEARGIEDRLAGLGVNGE
jgi:transcriptional regulator with XRE-family HTH domain/Zn-dependent peptidase ImmA (M78 family)